MTSRSSFKCKLFHGCINFNYTVGLHVATQLPPSGTGMNLNESFAAFELCLLFYLCEFDQSTQIHTHTKPLFMSCVPVFMNCKPSINIQRFAVNT